VVAYVSCISCLSYFFAPFLDILGRGAGGVSRVEGRGDFLFFEAKTKNKNKKKIKPVQNILY